MISRFRFAKHLVLWGFWLPFSWSSFVALDLDGGPKRRSRRGQSDALERLRWGDRRRTFEESRNGSEGDVNVDIMSITSFLRQKIRVQVQQKYIPVSFHRKVVMLINSVVDVLLANLEPAWGSMCHVCHPSTWPWFSSWWSYILFPILAFCCGSSTAMVPIKCLQGHSDTHIFR